MGKSGKKRKNRISSRSRERPTAARSSTVVRSLTAVPGNAATSPMTFNPSGAPSFQHQEISPSSESYATYRPTDLVSNEGPLPVDDITNALASGCSFQEEVSPFDIHPSGHPMFNAQAIILASDTTSNPSTTSVTIANNNHVVTLNNHRGPKRNYKNQHSTTTRHPGVYVDRNGELWYIMPIYYKGQKCSAWGSYPTSELASIVRLKIENFLQGLSKKIEPDDAFKLAVQKSRDIQKAYNIPESRILPKEVNPIWIGRRVEITFQIGYHDDRYHDHTITYYAKKETDQPKVLKKIIYVGERMRSYIQVNCINNGKNKASRLSIPSKINGLVRFRLKMELEYDSLPQESDSSLPQESDSSLPQESYSLSSHTDFDIQEYVDKDLK